MSRLETCFKMTMPSNERLGTNSLVVSTETRVRRPDGSRRTASHTKDTALELE